MLGAAFQHGCVPVSADGDRARDRAQRRRRGDQPGRVPLGPRRRRGPRPPSRGALAAMSARRPGRLEPGRGAGPGRAPAPGRRVAAGRRCADRAAAARRPICAATRTRRTRCATSTTSWRVLAAERERGEPGATPVTEAYAAAMHKLMAYKDEYEVARLHLDAFERARVDARFGADAKVEILLHPPVLRALGLRRKLRLGRRGATAAGRPAGRPPAARDSRLIRSAARRPPAGARADRRASRARPPGAAPAVARDRRAGAGDRRPAGHDPRLRGDQDRKRRALPRCRGRGDAGTGQAALSRLRPAASESGVGELICR